ncbi:phage major capsid protein [Heyndrickxia acidicola]|uniref:Phage major capsid protein n=1 Tax=Heyndrickxia acidicola TaxID=209389 RepID=A0ABU6MNA6_9BACI|nr:phage major capsid protein [Heyndrickxia acidicola]MED1205882.1 phage major capsid protein [Heyndrickxia acidicola]
MEQTLQELNTAWIQAGQRVSDLRAKRTLDMLDENVSVEEIATLSARLEAAEVKLDIAHLKYQNALNAGQTENNGDDKMNQKQKEIKAAYANLILQKPMTAEQKALVIIDDGTGNPVWQEEVFTDFQRPFQSIKQFVNVIPVKTFAGTFVFEDPSGITELTELVDYDSQIQEDDEKLESIRYKIRRFGSIIPVSLSNIQDSPESVIDILQASHEKKKARTENIEIFKMLQNAIATPSTLSSHLDLEKSLINDIDPALKDSVVIATNQSGFSKLVSTLDSTGNLENFLIYKMIDGYNSPVIFFNGFRIVYVSDEELPNVNGSAPFVFGSLFLSLKYFDKGTLLKSSLSYKFNQAMVSTRFIDQFDVQVANTDYQYGLMPLS